MDYAIKILHNEIKRLNGTLSDANLTTTDGCNNNYSIKLKIEQLQKAINRLSRLYRE